MPTGVYVRTEAHIKKLREILKGKIQTPEHNLAISRGKKGKKIKPHSIEHRKKQSESMLGNKNPNWKGGITKDNRRLREVIEYRLWRKAVFERDDYRCLDCGIKGIYLQADHIYPWAYFPRLRFDINNGQTLCIECHKKTHTFKGRARWWYNKKK